MPEARPMKPLLRALTLDEARRFWAACEEDGKCLRRVAPRGASSTYPKFYVSALGRTVLAARVAYALRYGDPGRSRVYHTCGNTWCVEARHLSRRHPGLPPRKGEKHPMAKLTSESVEEIRQRAAAGTLQQVLADEFGVSHQQISDIIRDKQWK